MEMKKRITTLGNGTRVFDVAITSFANIDQPCVISCASDAKADALMLALHRCIETYSIEAIAYGETAVSNAV